MAIKKVTTNFEKDIYSLTGSAVLLASNAVLSFLPFGNIIPLALTSISGGFMLTDLFNSKWDKTFKEVGLINKDGKMPKKLHEFKDDDKTTYIFETPSPMTAYDLIKYQDNIEASIHKPMRITVTKNFYAKVEVFEKTSLSFVWDKIFKSCGIKNKEGEYPEFIETEETKIGNKYIFKLPYGLCIEIFENMKPLIQSAIKKPLKFNLTPDYKLTIQEYDLHYQKFYTPNYNSIRPIKGKLIFPIGITLTENGQQIVNVDLTDEPHILVAGTNGSGKTNFIKCLLTAMILQNIEIKILDLKFGGDYNILKNYKYLTTFTKDVVVARNEITKIKDTMNERYHLLDITNCKDYISYNNKHKNIPMKPIVVVIEEYYMLNTKKNRIVEEMNQILAKSRACNIKFILSLQRPCKDNLDPILKANLNHTVGFRTVSIPNSEVVLGEGDNRLFKELHDKGEAIVHDMYQDVTFKSFYLEDDEESNKNKLTTTIEKLIASKCVEKNIQIEEPKSNVDKTIPIEKLRQKKEGKVDLMC